MQQRFEDICTSEQGVKNDVHALTNGKCSFYFPPLCFAPAEKLHFVKRMYGLKPSCAHTDIETLCSLRYRKTDDTVISLVFIFTLATKQVIV